MCKASKVLSDEKRYYHQTCNQDFISLPLWLFSKQRDNINVKIFAFLIFGEKIRFINASKKCWLPYK